MMEEKKMQIEGMKRDRHRKYELRRKQRNEDRLLKFQARQEKEVTVSKIHNLFL